MERTRLTGLLCLNGVSLLCAFATGAQETLRSSSSDYLIEHQSFSAGGGFSVSSNFEAESSFQFGGAMQQSTGNSATLWPGHAGLAVQIDPGLSWSAPASILYGVALDGQQLNASAAVPGAFAYNPPAGTILNAGANQSLTVRFTPGDNLIYETLTREVRLDVLKAPLVIRADDKTARVGTQLPFLSATFSGFVNNDTVASLNQPLTLATTAASSSPPGFYPIAPAGAASANYDVIFVPGTLTITDKELPILSWPAPAPIPFGTPLGSEQFNASANVPGVFSYSFPAGATLPAGNGQALSVLFTPQDTVNFQPVSAQVLINVLKANQTISFEALTERRLGDQFTLSASASSGLPANFSVSGPAFLSGNNLTTTGPGTVTVTASQVGSDNFNAAPPVSRQFFVRANTAPVLSPLSDRNIDEGMELTFVAQATDSDQPSQAITYSLDGTVPEGASINSSSGLFTWTPSEAQGPGVFELTVVATDNGLDNLSARQTLTITVNEVNRPPVLAGLSNQTVPEGSTLAMVLLAADPDLPANLLTYRLGPGAPDGASVDPRSGVFHWTPAEAQGPGIVPVTIIVTDDGPGALSATQTLVVTVLEVNTPPVLAPIPNQSIKTGETLALTLNASDSDLPPNTLSYLLPFGGPPGAFLDPTTGSFIWTPSLSAGASTNVITVEVHDNGSPSLSVTGNFIVIVSMANQPPVLPPMPDQTVPENTPFSLNLSATDPDVPAQTLRYRFEGNVPAGAAIDAQTGTLSWSPSEEQGPGSHRFTVIVTDDGTPPLSASRSFSLMVQEVNTPPVLELIPDQTVDEQTLLTFSARASDPDLPANRLAYSLGSGAPPGASVNPSTGQFSWTPTEAQGPSTNRLTLRVEDDGDPPLSVSRTFAIVVHEVNEAPSLAEIQDQFMSLGDSLRLELQATDPDRPANALQFSLTAGVPSGLGLDPATGLLTWRPEAAQAPSTNQITVQVTDNGLPPLTASRSFRITVREGVNRPPTISAFSHQNTPENVPTPQIAFLIDDPDTPIGNLRVQADSSNSALVPRSNLLLRGSGRDRTLQIIPAQNQSGTATITITVDEPAGGVANARFDITVLAQAVEIVRQPQDQGAQTASEITFSILAKGSLPLFYQWRHNGNPIPGATNSALALVNLHTNLAGLYSVEVSNRVGRVFSRDARLSLFDPLRITVQPQAQTVLAGSGARFSVAASGTGLLAYQWRFNGADIPGATQATLALNQVEPILAGSYAVVIRDANGSITSQEAALLVLDPVRIVEQPRSMTARLGTNATFRVSVQGSPPISYQWRFNGVALPGQTNAALSLANLDSSSDGSYSVLARNPAGSSQSEAAFLTVQTSPAITRQPESQSVAAGSAVTFSVSASGTPPLAFQWRRDSAEVPGATGPSLTLTNVSQLLTGDYSVIVSNAAGSVPSEPATLAVLELVRIITPPQSQTVVEGGSATFAVEAGGSAPLSYQWQHNGVNLAGATNATLTLAGVQRAQSGDYKAVVRNPAGTRLTPPAQLTVQSPARVLVQPRNQNALIGSHVDFEVAAAGTAPLSYQWRFNGADIANATRPILSIASVQPSHSGRYDVIVQNPAGVATSVEALLSVLSPPSIRTQPESRNVPPGSDVTFRVEVAGAPPFSYQWRRNGVTIPGAGDAVLTLSNVQPADAGAYSVVVQNQGGTVVSSTAELTLILPPFESGSSAATAPPPLEAAEGSFDGGSNESGAGLAAKKNAPPTTNGERWYAWRAPGSGIARFTTAGSNFDTVLSIYSGSIPDLTEITSDDDRGGFLASEVRFNAEEGSTYLIRVAGFEGAAGRIVIGFQLMLTAQKLPVFLSEPASQSVLPGSDAAFAATVEGQDLSYQWLADGAVLPGENAARLLLRNVQNSDAKRYSVRAVSSAGGNTSTNESWPASLQIGTLAGLAEDKFKSALKRDAGTPGASPQALAAPPPPPINAYAGSLVFSTFGATQEKGEPSHCQVVGGASYWLAYRAPDQGTLRLSTEGSDFDTLLAVYAGSEHELENLRQLACDNNGGADGRASLLRVSVEAGQRYYIAVDGARGATGKVQLHYNLAREPAISRQPIALSLRAGEGAALFVQTTNHLAGTGAAAPIESFQWIKDGIPVPGQTNNSFAIPGVSTADAGLYAVAVSNFAGTTISDAVRLEVSVPLAVTVPPADQFVALGSVARFQAVLSGSEPIVYQWRFNGVELPGATNALLEIPAVETSHAGIYTVLARNAAGTLESAPAALTLRLAPFIAVPPASLTVPLGGSTNLYVVALGAEPLRYQWQLNGADLPNAVKPALELINMGPSHAGRYTVVVANAAGTVISSPATVALRLPFELAEVPQSQTVRPGNSALFNVRATGSGPFRFQWKREDLDVPGATNSFFAIRNVQPSDAARYRVVVSQGNESMESPFATLAVIQLPIITEQPSNATLFAGETARLAVRAESTNPLNYQWLRNGEPIDGALEPSLTLANVPPSAAGNYSVLVGNAAGTIASDLAVLTVREIVSAVQMGALGFQFRLSVPEGKQARIQHSPDFIEWLDLAPEPSHGTLEIQDLQSLGATERFYRIVIE